MLAGVAVMVRDKYAVRLAPEQREELQRLIRVGKRPARVTARARILLKSDDGWPAPQVAEALDVPLSPTGAELLFEVFSQRYERGSILVTTNLPFDEWTEVFGSERLTGALLDRLTHHVHILEMNGESYRLKRSREGVASQTQDKPHEE